MLRYEYFILVFVSLIILMLFYLDKGFPCVFVLLSTAILMSIIIQINAFSVT